MSARILLVDDHPLMLDGVRELLERRPELEVVGAVTNGLEALAAVGELRPDIVVMDFEMPELNGVDATRRIVQAHPGVQVICLSVHVERRFVTAMFEAGASAYLTKHCGIEELVRAIDAVRRAEAYLSPRVTREAIEGLLTGGGAPDEQATSAFGALTAKERHVLQLLAEGETTKEIADRLRVSQKTVGSHRENIMRKLKIRSVAGLTKYAIREGLTTLEH